MNNTNKLFFLKTDVLPNEVPLIFSNELLYKHLQENIDDWDKINIERNNKKLNDYMHTSIPFFYKIDKNDEQFRKIALLHPYAQIQITKFIETYENFILNYLHNNSIYSLRYPSSVNTYDGDALTDMMRKFKSEVRWLTGLDEDSLPSKSDHLHSSYFKLNKFSKITSFYKSKLMKTLEIKYKHLMRLDYQNCFDNIYTHSIDWAYLGGKALAKECIHNRERFSSILDKLMQTINYNETNGIVVGPEFSRLVAEIVLSRIDSEVYYELNDKNIIFDKDYTVLRFIDDIFIFYNNPIVGDMIRKTITTISMDYKMEINIAKTKNEKKPFLREQLWLPKVKNEIQLFKTYFEDKLTPFKDYPYNRFIENIRLILVSHESYKRNIISYVLSAIENDFKSLIEVEYEDSNDIENINKDIKRHYQKLINLITSIINYSINSDNVLKVSRMMLTLQITAKNKDIDIDKFIFDEIYQLLKYNTEKTIEMLNFIIVLAFNKYFLPESFITDSIKNSYDYFTMSTFTYYVSNIKSNAIKYRNAERLINDIIQKYIDDAIFEYNLQDSNYSKSNVDLLCKYDNLFLSEHFYVLHDFYSSKILNTKNKKIISKIITNHAEQKSKSHLELYNVFLSYIIKIDKPFMNWNANLSDIIEDAFSKKYSNVDIY